MMCSVLKVTQKSIKLCSVAKGFRSPVGLCKLTEIGISLRAVRVRLPTGNSADSMKVKLELKPK